MDTDAIRDKKQVENMIATSEVEALVDAADQHDHGEEHLREPIHEETQTSSLNRHDQYDEHRDRAEHMPFLSDERADVDDELRFR